MGDQKPVLQVQLNVDDIMKETVTLIKAVREEIEIVSNAVNLHMNESIDGAIRNVAKIVGDVETITKNMAITTNAFYQPVLLFMSLLILVLLLLSILLFCMLRTRREYKKQPIKLKFRKRRGRTATRRVPEHTSTETINEEAQPPGYGTTAKRKNDTLV
ncbi:unnamed protein product [Bursaphelenchus xylophilus]|uniref:(pine wood nematode) hypothetical protein n=1 Tax=Bursaphelenchus xylophilus TaxID=6326 RepID=A0A7I8X4Q5_BURXY|nr:unnamed protein product [Bursaphelenchus xylophilus]CAG9122356.1 unnamed protein product [Bursaphelenchus xylophilus]